MLKRHNGSLWLHISVRTAQNDVIARSSVENAKKFSRFARSARSRHVTCADVMMCSKVTKLAYSDIVSRSVSRYHHVNMFWHARMVAWAERSILSVSDNRGICQNVTFRSYSSREHVQTFRIGQKRQFTLSDNWEHVKTAWERPKQLRWAQNRTTARSKHRKW